MVDIVDIMLDIVDIVSPHLMTPPMVLKPAPSSPRPCVSWAATGSSLLVTLVPRTFLPVHGGRLDSNIYNIHVGQ